MKFIKKIRKDEEGATAIEYGLIAALIAVAAITAMGALGTQLSGTFQGVAGELENAPGNTGGSTTGGSTTGGSTTGGSTTTGG